LPAFDQDLLTLGFYAREGVQLGFEVFAGGGRVGFYFVLFALMLDNY